MQHRTIPNNERKKKRGIVKKKKKNKGLTIHDSSFSNKTYVQRAVTYLKFCLRNIDLPSVDEFYYKFEIIEAYILWHNDCRMFAGI